MNPRPRLMISSLLAIACSLLAGVAAAATQLSWYGNGATQGGDGQWNTNYLYLDWSANGSNFQAWNNSNNDGATFDGYAGSVWVTEPITAGNLIFNGAWFELTDYGGTVTLAGSATVFVQNGSTAIISLPLAGSAGVTLSSSGNGELVLASTIRTAAPRPSPPPSCNWPTPMHSPVGIW